MFFREYCQNMQAFFGSIKKNNLDAGGKEIRLISSCVSFACQGKVVVTETVVLFSTGMYLCILLL